MALNRRNKVKVPNTSSAADVLEETMTYYHITQQDLADRIGVTQKHISDILNKKRYLNEVLALRIEKVMGISSQLLLHMDTSYKLNHAETEVNDKSQSSDTFLQKYNWVTN